MPVKLRQVSKKVEDADSSCQDEDNGYKMICDNDINVRTVSGDSGTSDDSEDQDDSKNISNRKTPERNGSDKTTDLKDKGFIERQRMEQCSHCGDGDDISSVKNISASFHTEEYHAWQQSNVWLCFISISCLSFGTRLYGIEEPRHVCWDETHFGKMGSWYINHTFFFDVHPPLGKMLIGLSGHLTGYDGTYPFEKPGEKYGDTPYLGMRLFCAILGSAVPPLAFLTVWELTASLVAAFIAALMLILDTGTLALSRYILLDPILLFFIMASTHTCVKLHTLRHRPFSAKWWLYLSLTGMFIANAFSVKFVGLFVVLLVGMTTIQDLWKLLGDMSLSMYQVFVHFVSRAGCLIALPVLIYVITFYIHFAVLYKSGKGDGFYSSAFQSRLEGNKLYNVSMPANIAYGSVITLKQSRTGGAYLHSHAHLYPEEAKPVQQQVTTYSHQDSNNKWLIKKAHVEPNVTIDGVEYVRNGDLIRLEHVVTGRNLHSHREPAPITKKHYQVSGYGGGSVGDPNDVWQIEMGSAEIGAPIGTVRSLFRLRHHLVKCLLYSHDKKLPKWGWEQLEVTCIPTSQKSKRAEWNVEEIQDERMANVNFEVYKASFLEMIMEAHAVMLQGNSGMTPKEGEDSSQPWQWPITYKGQWFSAADKKIYMLGNPIIFWLNLVLMVTFILSYIMYAVQRQRHAKISAHLKAYSDNVFSTCWWLFLGWALHYLPFWGMGRVLYFHHYFPAVLFSSMLSGVLLDYLMTRASMCLPQHMSTSACHWMLGAVLVILVYSFYLFHPLAYGMIGPDSKNSTSVMYGLRWMSSWEF